MVTGLTRREAPRLLRMVGGKRHASDKDHEEPAYKGRPHAKKNSERKKDEEEQFIHAEPVSTDDELQQPPPRTSSSLKPKIPVPVKSTDTELKQPQKKSSGKGTAIRTPARGMYQSGKADKAKRGIEDDKENATSTPTSMEASQENGWGFDDELSQPSPKKQKMQYGTKARRPATNIHVSLTKNSTKEPTRKPSRMKGRISYTRKSRPVPREENDVSDVSMVSEGEQDSELVPIPKKIEDSEPRTKVVKKKGPKDEGRCSKPTTMDDVELNSILDEPSKPARLLHQLGDWVQDQAPSSSQPESSGPQEALENLHEYIEQLPQDEEEGTQCSLCKESVEIEDYWEFWKGKNRTVKNHTAFCNTHRRKSAHEEYQREGYPEIDWDALPTRIKAHRQDLYNILNNKRPSKYRDRYQPIALTGKAASLPSRRKDLPQHLQDELDSYALDDKTTYPGYYGPHGRRAITENVMKVLKNEIKACKDGVVQASGPAAFIQAVLVPEVAVKLIMQDCTVGRDEAEEIRERTYEMGLLLNEEIEDCLEGGEDEDDGSEDEGW